MSEASVPAAGDSNSAAVPEDPAYAASMLQRDAELLPLYIAVQTAPNGTASQQAAAALQKVLSAHVAVNEAVRRAAAQLLQQPQVINLLQVLVRHLNHEFPLELVTDSATYALVDVFNVLSNMCHVMSLLVSLKVCARPCCCALAALCICCWGYSLQGNICFDRSFPLAGAIWWSAEFATACK